MAKAYVLLQFDVNDAEMFRRYREGALPIVAAYGGKPEVAGNAADVREGALPAKLVTILEFPSREAAEGWYTAPEYAAVKHLRHDATKGSLAFLDGYVTVG